MKRNEIANRLWRVKQTKLHARRYLSYFERCVASIDMSASRVVIGTNWPVRLAQRRV
jgi:hypothetical protein